MGSVPTPEGHVKASNFPTILSLLDQMLLLPSIKFNFTIEVKSEVPTPPTHTPGLRQPLQLDLLCTGRLLPKLTPRLFALVAQHLV